MIIGGPPVSPTFAYTPLVWPMLAPAVLLVPLGVYAWRRRSAPGARPFVFLVGFLGAWAVGAALELAAVTPEAKLSWFVFKSLWKLPAGTASLLFALDYAGLGSRLDRRARLLLAVPAAVPFLLVAAGQGTASLVSAEAVAGGRALSTIGPVDLALAAWSLVVVVASPLVFLWLLVTSSPSRWPAALCLCGFAATRAGYFADVHGVSPLAPMDSTVLGSILTAALYAVALGPFRMLELVPLARGTLLDQMADGVLVLDARRRVVDLNPAAARVLGVSASEARGRAARELLPALPEAGAALDLPEIRLGERSGGRHYAPSLSPILHRSGARLGELVVLRDVTESRRAAAMTLDQERALAALRERDLLARELHDSLGQVLGFAKMQAQAAREHLARGNGPAADAQLARLVSVAQEAHADVREFLLAARPGGSREAAFLPALEEYLRRFQVSAGLPVTLDASPAFAAANLEPMAGTQLLRILQETLTNVRKHAGARAVRVRLSAADGHVEAVVEDDGAGFDAAAAEAGTYGLRFMCERAFEVGGAVRVESAPGRGTRVAVTVPFGGRPS